MSDLVFSVRDFQAHIGDALRAVERGDHVIVTSRGRPVAEVTRPRKKTIAKEDRMTRILHRMAAEGRVILAKKPGPIDFPLIDVPGAGAQFRKDREERDRILGIPPKRTRRRKR